MAACVSILRKLIRRSFYNRALPKSNLKSGSASDGWGKFSNCEITGKCICVSQKLNLYMFLIKPHRQGKILPQFLIITSQAEENYSLPPGSVLRKSMSSLKDYCNSGVKKHCHKILANVF